MLDNVTLDQLRVLVAVAETGSFSGAGRRLGRVQSAISQAVQALEASLGVALFDRSRKTPQMTDAGRALLAQARQVLVEAAALRARAAALGAGMEPELTLAVDNLFPTRPLLASLKALAERFPDLSVTLHTAPIFAAERKLREGGANLALCGLRPGTGNDLVARPVTAIEMIPVAAPSHPLGQDQGPLSRDTLSRHVQLILTDPFAPPDAPSFGVVSPRVWRFVDLGPRLEFLLAGFGWCNMPRHIAAPLIAGKSLVQLDLSEPHPLPIRLPMYAVHTRDRPPGPAGRWFLDQLQAACQAETAQG